MVRVHRIGDGVAVAGDVTTPGLLPSPELTCIFEQG
jgi:hypothetical protein